MSHILTLVAAGNSSIQQKNLEDVRSVLVDHGLEQVGDLDWLSVGKAVDAHLSEAPSTAVMRSLRNAFTKMRIDVCVSVSENRQKKLVLVDMDKTTITEETLDEIGDIVDARNARDPEKKDVASVKDRIAQITDRAMNDPTISFDEAVRQRIGILVEEGVSRADLQQALDNLVLSAGIKTFVQVMNANGAHCVLVSGGFTFFTEAVGAEVGFEAHHGNVFLFDAADKLTGVADPIEDADSKLVHLKHYMDKYGVEQAATMAIGDGSNDLKMIEFASMGIGFGDKEAVLSSDGLNGAVVHGDHTTSLYFQGYREDEIKPAL